MNATDMLEILYKGATEIETLRDKLAKALEDNEVLRKFIKENLGIESMS